MAGTDFDASPAGKKWGSEAVKEELADETPDKDEEKNAKREKRLRRLTDHLFESFRNDKHSETAEASKIMEAELKDTGARAGEAILLADTSLLAELQGDKAFKAYRDACAKRHELTKLWWPQIASNMFQENKKDGQEKQEEDKEGGDVDTTVAADGQASPSSGDLRAALNGMPVSERPVMDVKTMYTKPELDAFADKIPDLDTPSKIEDAMEDFKVLKKTFQQFVQGARSHEAEGQGCGRHAEKCEQHKGAIFSIPANKWTDVPQVSVATVMSPNSAADRDKPWIIKGSDVVKEWRDLPSIILKMSEYGGSYKKIGGSSLKEDGRTQSPMLAQNGKDETDVMLNKILPTQFQIDISSMASGTRFMQSVWMLEYSVDMAGCWPTPNSASMVKVLSHGQIQVVAFPIIGLPEFLKCENMDDICQGLVKVKAEEFDKSSPGYFGTVDAGDVLHITAGWLVCERCTSGTLIYGVRKSWDSRQR
jgi:hypothetical protein